MTPLDKLDRFEELVMTLGNRESRGVRLIACTPDFAQFVVADGSVIVVLRHTLGDADRLDRMVLRVCEGLKQGTMFLVAAGGGHEARNILQEHAPRARFGKKIYISALDDGIGHLEGKKLDVRMVIFFVDFEILQNFKHG